jgi:hypothetical protein
VAQDRLLERPARGTPPPVSTIVNQQPASRSCVNPEVATRIISAVTGTKFSALLKTAMTLEKRGHRPLPLPCRTKTLKSARGIVTSTENDGSFTNPSLKYVTLFSPYLPVLPGCVRLLCYLFAAWASNLPALACHGGAPLAVTPASAPWPRVPRLMPAAQHRYGLDPDGREPKHPPLRGSTPPGTCPASLLRRTRRERLARHCQSLGPPSTRSTACNFPPNAHCKRGNTPRSPFCARQPVFPGRYGRTPTGRTGRLLLPRRCPTTVQRGIGQHNLLR